MAQNYTRQSAFSDGDTITATLFNDEYNQLVNTFTYSSSDASATGHRHDGSTGEGGNIYRIGDLDFLNKIEADSSNNRWGFWVEVSSIAVEQLRIQDGAIVPVTDNDIDLGTSSLEFKNLYLDGTAKVDSLVVDETATITGAATLSSTLTVEGATTLNGNTTLGNAATDTVTITADVSSNIIPSADSTYTLGDSSNYWSAGYIDAITTTGNVSVGGNLTVTGNATISGNLTFGDADTDTVSFSADVSSHILPDVDDTYDLGSSTKEWRNLYIDGTANIDSLVADTADINGGTIDGAIIATSDVTVGAGKTLDVSAGTLTLADNQISGDKVEGGTIAATTITSLASTTVDTTNIEVTNLKAKDGTAAGSIADATGVVTLASSVLTTTDINGGTIDGATIATSDITVGAGKTLDVSAGTFTVANDQISGDAINGGTATPTNLTVSGTTSLAGASTTADITFGDNDKAIFGAGSDLQIYHDGSNSYITDSGTGNLRISGTLLQLNDASFNKYLLGSGDSVTLYHADTAKLATTATGIDVTGTVTADGLTVSNAVGSVLKLESTGEGIGAGVVIGDIQFYGNDASTPGAGIKAGIKVETVASLGDDAQMKFTTSDGTTNNIDRLLIANNGDISFYEDTGTTPKFFWDASAESLGIGTSSPGELLHLEVPAVGTGSGEVAIRMSVPSDIISAQNEIRSGVTSGTNPYISFAVRETSSPFATVERMRLDASGNLLVGRTTTITFGSNTTTGAVINEDGRIDAAADGESALILQRLNSDGNIANFYKDGTTVGSIGTAFSVPYLANSSNFGIRVDDANNGELLPADSSGTGADAAADLGRSNIRWKDLYLSGDIALNNGSKLYFASTACAIEGTSSGADYIKFTTNNSETMRLDASGNLLVGKTSTALGTVGHEFGASGYAYHTRDNNTVLYLNRNTSDGDIAKFYKDGTTVGSIGSYSGTYLTSGSNAAGLAFIDAGSPFSIRPHNISTNAPNDAALDLGASSARWNNLYLSGGVYLGGTGAANKLDDYEEGTFTPAYSVTNATITHDLQSGVYTKIGNMVYFRILLGTDAATGSFSGSNVLITGFPFTANGTISGSVGLNYAFASELDGPKWLITNGTTTVSVYKSDNTATIVTGAQFGTGGNANRLYIAGAYTTNA